MSDKEEAHPTEEEQAQFKVLKHQAETLQQLDERATRLQEQLDATISDSEALLERIGQRPDAQTTTHPSRPITVQNVTLRPWSEIVAEAEAHFDEPISIADLLTTAEIDAVTQRLALAREEFEASHRLDKLDWALCGLAGILAALVDILLIQMPKHPGFLGSEASEGGPLANWVRDKINSSLSPDEVRRLEAENWVPFDAAHSRDLNEAVAGLSPSTHRFHSLGHDPVLSFIFGVKDILLGTFTAIDKNGRWIVQSVDLKDPSAVGLNLFEAIGRVVGHLKSDLTTPRGLPAPLMPLFQLLQVGNIGQRGYTIGQVSRMMYRNGYDFRHFLAMSIPTILIEVFVRLGYCARRIADGDDLAQALPINLPGHHQPKLQTMLFSAHLMATAANAGKVAHRSKSTLDQLSAVAGLFQICYSAAEMGDG